MKVLKEIGMLVLSLVIYSEAEGQITKTDEARGVILDTLIDPRDGSEYEIIKIDSIWWFNENLRYRTADSNCYQDEPLHCVEKGRLYSYRDLNKICPENWRLPTKHEFDELLRKFSIEAHGGILYVDATWDTINARNRIGYKFQKTGFKHKKKFKSALSMNLWLSEEEEGYHVHMYEEKKSKRMVIFRHNHEARHSIINKRKFAARCICYNHE